MPSKTQTVLVVGSGAHDATLGQMCKRAFESLEYEVTFFDKRTRTVPVLDWAIGTARMQKRLITHCRDADPDLVFVIKGEQLRPETVNELSEMGTIVCNWNPDNPFQTRSAHQQNRQYLQTLGAYDEVFIWSDKLFEPLRDAGACSVHELPFGFDPELHRPVEPDPNIAADVVFAGHWSEKRQTMLTPLLDLDAELAVYGNGWKKHCFDRTLRAVHRGPAIFGEDYSALYRSTTICLNIVADHNLEAYNMRSFEIPATGGFMLTSRTDKQRSLFGEGEGIACFDDPTELREQVAYYLNADGERNAIADSGHKTVQSHSYRNRMKTVVEIVFNG